MQQAARDELAFLQSLLPKSAKGGQAMKVKIAGEPGYFYDEADYEALAALEERRNQTMLSYEARIRALEAALQLIGNELSLHADRGPAGEAFRALLNPTLPETKPAPHPRLTSDRDESEAETSASHFVPTTNHANLKEACEQIARDLAAAKETKGESKMFSQEHHNLQGEYEYVFHQGCGCNRCWTEHKRIESQQRSDANRSSVK